MKKTITLFSLILFLGYLAITLPVFGTTPEGRAITLKEKISNVIDNIKEGNLTENKVASGNSTEVVAATGKTMGRHGFFDPNVIYVDVAATSGGNNGTSWTDAYTDLQNAITNAVSGDSIFVAKGTYQPAIGMSFSMKEGVKIYGSFQGTETSSSERTMGPTDTTILEGNGVSVIFNNDLTSDAVLDGFKITSGSGSTDGIGGTTVNGGGISNYSSSITIRNVAISGNTAIDNGGGIYNFNSSPTLTNVLITGNSVGNSGDDHNGGGIANFNNSNPLLNSVTISGNTGFWGGGISNDNSSPTLTNVIITGNTSGDIGGGILNNNSSAPTLTDVIISGNSSIYGGGIMNWQNSNPQLTNVAVTGNSADQVGGGIANNISSPTLINVAITGNLAGNLGGGIYNLASSPKLINVTIVGNNDNSTAGGIYNATDNSISSTPSLENTMVLGNNSGIDGDAIDATSSFYAIQTTTGNADYNNGTTTSSITLSPTDVFTLAEDPANAPTTNGDYSLKAGSFAIDKGDNALFPGLDANTKDLSGNPRVFNFGGGGIIDLGAYEYQSSVTPLKLIAFNGVKENADVLLSWSTATESNVDRFEVERSTDGNNFNAIGSVKATGNSSVLQNYSYTDLSPVNGNNFYRLKMIDLDGSSTYSPVATVRFAGSSSWKLSPNPAASFITLQASTTVSGKTSLNIYSSVGKIVGRYSLNAGDQILKINVDNLTSGTYFLEINNQNGKETIPFVKK